MSRTMTRERWRELCKNTPRGNSGPARPWFVSTNYEWISVHGLPRFVSTTPGRTYRKAK